MPNTYRTLIQSAVLGLALLAALTLGAADAHAEWEGDELNLIVTNGSGRAWRPYNPPDELDGEKRFTEKVKALSAEDEEALLLDQGGFTVPNHDSETSYFSPMAKFYFDTGFAAVNMTAKDFLYYGASSKGAKRRDPRHVDLYLCAMDYKSSMYLDIPSHISIPTDNGVVELIALTDPDRIAGVPVVQGNASITPPEKVLETALASKQGPAIAFSDFPPAKNDAFAQSWPALDVILEYTEGPAEARKVGKTLIIPKGKPWEFQKITLKLDGDARPTGATIERVPWVTEDEYDSLRRLTLSKTGMGVYPQNIVAERFNITEDNVSVDIHRNNEFSTFTERETIKVYLINVDGKPYRVYRVHHNDLKIGWMHFDAMVQIDPETHRIVRLVTNLTDYPVAYFPTRFGEVIDGILNQDPEDWEMPEDAIAGYEDQAEEVLRVLKSAIELDKKLYKE